MWRMWGWVSELLKQSWKYYETAYLVYESSGVHVLVSFFASCCLGKKLSVTVSLVCAIYEDIDK